LYAFLLLDLSLELGMQVRRHHKSLWINHNDSISTLAVGNGVLYSGSWDKSVKVWRLSDFKCLESLTHHIDAVNALAVDNPCNLLFSGSGDATIKVYHNKPPKATKTRHTLIATLGTNSPVNALALSHPLLYSAQSDKTVTVWKMKEVEGEKAWSTVATLRGHRHAVLCVVTLPNLVISGSADKTVRVWRRGGDGVHSAVSVMVGHAGPVKSLCAVLDMAMGALVYSGSMDGDVRVWWIPEDETDLVSSDDGSPHSPLLVNWRPSSNKVLPSLPSL
jgi:WD40 repeat protein